MTIDTLIPLQGKMNMEKWFLHFEIRGLLSHVK